MEYLPTALTGGSVQRASESSGTEGSDSTAQFLLPTQGISLDEVEMSFVRQAIERSEGNQTRAAVLGISRDQLRYRLKKLEDTESLAAGPS